MSTFDKIKALTKQLLPTGRAFLMPVEGDKLIESSAVGQSATYDGIVGTLDSILPDNSNFTEEDATAWEIRLGMIVSAAPLADRKKSIIRKMNHPGVIPARQSSDYLESQLQAHGFTGLFVHENNDHSRIDEILNESTPTQLGDNQLGDAQLGNPFTSYSDCLHKIQLGDVQLGGWQVGSSRWCDIIANNIDVEIDKLFFIGSNNRTFIIGGTAFGTFGTLDSDRKEEFRQLVLRIKPVRTIAYVLINYT